MSSPTKESGEVEVAQPHEGFELVTTENLFDRYIEDMQAAEDRIVIQGMSMTYDEATSPLLDLLLEKAVEIDEVVLLPDSFSLQFDDAKMRINPFGKHAKAINKFKDYTKALESKGGKVRFTNPHRATLNPYAGRSHIKTAVMGNVIYDWGGVDPKTTGFSNIDSMIRFQDPSFADETMARITDVYEIGRLATKSDFCERIGPHGFSVTDTGLPGRSLIYDYITEILSSDDITGVKYISQMQPTGKVKEVISTLQRNLSKESVVVASNRPASLVLPAFVMESVRNIYNNIHLSYLAEPNAYLHEKLLLIYRANQATIAIKGSHNMLDQGVKYGTSERTLFTTDDFLVEQIEARVDDLKLVEA